MGSKFPELAPKDKNSGKTKCGKLITSPPPPPIKSRFPCPKCGNNDLNTQSPIHRPFPPNSIVCMKCGIEYNI